MQRSHTPLQFNAIDNSVISPPSHVEQHQPVADDLGHIETVFPDAITLARSSSSRSQSSIAKLPLDAPSSSGLPARPPPLRSIFPTYDPELPLDQQAYGPTQMSPSHIPRAVISRQSYYDNDAISIVASQAYSARPLQQQLGQQQQQKPRSLPTRYQQQDTLAFSAGNRAPTRVNTLSPPVIPKTSTTDQLKTFWKAANGWKAAPSEGRLFCLKLTQLKDAPVYTLSSASQPLYNLRLDPTSASALVSLSRHDPNRVYKPPKAEVPPSSSSSSSGPNLGTNSKPDSKHWQQVLHTTMEEESRKHPPNDGLVALLMPDPATKMAIERSDEPALVAMAEKECARLVWDEDSSSNYLVHPALAAPFCITVERCPAWSRVEYTLEHHESPRHLAKLTRDGTGSGWLEIDTSVASHIEAYYIIDVAVAALLIVSASEERSGNGPVVNAAGGVAGAGMETFEPPPRPVESATRSDTWNSGRFSKLSVRKDDRKQRRQMEEFEVDLESQDGSLTKAGARIRTKSKRKSKESEKEERLPFFIRAGVKLTKGVFKFVIWMLTAIFRVLFKCVRSKY